MTPYTIRDANYQINEGKKKHESIGDYIQLLLAGPYPWNRIRSAQKILRIADKYGHERTADACRKALEYGMTDVKRIEKMLKNGVEKKAPDNPKTYDLRLFEVSRFAREANYFKNYN